LDELPGSPLASLQALTSSDAQEQATILRWLLKMQCGNGLMHESVRVDLRVDEPADCTRPVFEWANAMAAASVEALLPGVDCDVEAQALHLRAIKEREGLLEPTGGTQQQEGDAAADPADLDYDQARFFERIEQTINTVSSAADAGAEAAAAAGSTAWVFDSTSSVVPAASDTTTSTSTVWASGGQESSYNGIPFEVAQDVASAPDPTSTGAASVSDMATSSSSVAPAAEQQSLNVLQSSGGMAVSNQAVSNQQGSSSSNINSTWAFDQDSTVATASTAGQQALLAALQASGSAITSDQLLTSAAIMQTSKTQHIGNPHSEKGSVSQPAGPARPSSSSGSVLSRKGGGIAAATTTVLQPVEASSPS
jgi:hypothetical protein